jgi:hypothetical protein
MLKLCGVHCLAFPDHKGPATKSGKVFTVSFITIYVSLKLILPEIFSTFGIIKILTAFIPMPETTMNKNDCSVFWEDNIGFTWKVFPVKSKTKTHFHPHSNAS